MMVHIVNGVCINECWEEAIVKKHILIVTVIVLGTLTALIMYNILINQKDSIYIESYDRTATFELIEYRVETLDININDDFNEVFFTVANNLTFLEEVQTNPFYQYTVSYNHGSGVERDVHIFMKNGYGYILYLDTDNKFVLRPAAGLIVSDDYTLLFPYFTNGYFSSGEHVSFDTIDSVMFDSFESYVAFFQLYTGTNIIINEQTKTIQLLGYDYMTTRDDIFVEIVFDATGFTPYIRER